MPKVLIVVAAGAAAAIVAAPAGASDATVKEGLVRGVAQIRASQGAKTLEAQLVRTVARLRSDRGSTALGRTGRRLAIQGFGWTLKGVETQLDLVANDSGNIEAAVRDAKRADRYLEKGADLLRSAGRVLRVRVGTLNGH
jgi:hypothetical protein